MPPAAHRSTRSVSMEPWAVRSAACSKKKCDVRCLRFSQRTVPMLGNGPVCPGVGVVEYTRTGSSQRPAAWSPPQVVRGTAAGR
jgi:hypothetical protein